MLRWLGFAENLEMADTGLDIPRKLRPEAWEMPPARGPYE